MSGYDKYAGRSARDNSFGLIRIVLASAVIVSHAYVLSGHGSREFVARFSGGQDNLGGIAVAGFFIVSGFLVCRSALRSSSSRYAWKRFIRIFPGFWVCLLTTAIGFAPLVWLHEHSSLHGFFSHAQGPFEYVRVNAFIGMNQYGIGGLLQRAPGGLTAFDGSLWTLADEVACYVVVGVLAAVVLKRAPRAAGLTIAGLLYGRVAIEWLKPTHKVIELPFLSRIDTYWLVILGFYFALGCLFEVFAASIPPRWPLAAAAAVALLISLRFGAWMLVGPFALAYAVMWLAVALPAWTRRVGRRNDYSYGIYIYAFPVQQTLIAFGLATGSVAVFSALTFLITLPLAAASWHLVERRALSLRRGSDSATSRCWAPPPMPPPEPPSTTGTAGGIMALASTYAPPKRLHDQRLCHLRLQRGGVAALHADTDGSP